MKAKILENRIKRLESEETRALRHQKMAEKKAEQMLEARKRHNEALISKLRKYEEEQQSLERKKKETRDLMEFRKASIRSVIDRVVSEKRQIKQNVRAVGELLGNARIVNELTDMHRKKVIWKQINQQRDIQKNQTQELIPSEGTMRYRHQETQIRQEAIESKISKMERIEQELLERLRKT